MTGPSDSKKQTTLAGKSCVGLRIGGLSELNLTQEYSGQSPGGGHLINFVHPLPPSNSLGKQRNQGTQGLCRISLWAHMVHA